MAQSFPAIAQTATIKDSRQLLLDRDSASASNFSGAAFPTTNLMVGMKCHRTDLGKTYILKDASSQTWIEETDFSGTSGKSPQATKLATARNFSIQGDGTATAVSFDGSAAVALNLALAATGVVAGTYTKVTVDAKGRVTVGATLSNADLPADLSRSTLRVSSGVSATLSSTTHGLGIGPDSGANIAMDGNQIQARNNGAASALRLNFLGGNVVIGDGASTTITLDGLLSSGGQAIATNAEALAGTANNKIMTPLRVAQQVAPEVFSSNTMTDVSGSRAFSTNYQNNSGSWRAVSVETSNNGITITAGPTTGSLTPIFSVTAAFAAFVMIPPGWYYRITGSGSLTVFES
jgi:hypothetical protein